MEEILNLRNKRLSIYKKPKNKLANRVDIYFEEPLIFQDIYGYGKICNRLYWNVDKNKNVVGIYFDEKNKQKLKDNIVELLYYMGQYVPDEYK